MPSHGEGSRSVAGQAPFPHTPLFDIIADMVSSSLAWEKDHGLSYDQGGKSEELKGISLGIHCPPLNEISQGGQPDAEASAEPK